MRYGSLGLWTAVIIAIFAGLMVAKHDELAATKRPCDPQMNSAFATAVAEESHKLEGIRVCGKVSGRPREFGNGANRHISIPVELQAPGATYLTEVIPNETLVGEISVKDGDTIMAFGQFIYPNTFAGGRYQGLIHETHAATHRGGVNGYVLINGRTYH